MIIGVRNFLGSMGSWRCLTPLVVPFGVMLMNKNIVQEMIHKINYVTDFTTLGFQMFKVRRDRNLRPEVKPWVLHLKSSYEIAAVLSCWMGTHFFWLINN
jgi:hypothetical protein